VRDVLGVLAGNDPLAGQDGGDVVAVAAVVLIEGQDRQRVVRLRPLHVGIQVGLQPGVAGRDRAIVHVIAEVGGHQGNRGQGREVGRPGGVGSVVGGVRGRRPVGRRVVLAGVITPVSASGAAQVAVARHRFVEASNGEAGGQELGAQGAGGKCVRAAVVGDALGGARPQSQVVGLAGVPDGKGLGHQGILLGQRVDIGCGRAADDLLVGVVLHNHNHDMVGARRHGGRIDELAGDTADRHEHYGDTCEQTPQPAGASRPAREQDILDDAQDPVSHLASCTDPRRASVHNCTWAHRIRGRSPH
jgi:hypothetical protein